MTSSASSRPSATRRPAGSSATWATTAPRSQGLTQVLRRRDRVLRQRQEAPGHRGEHRRASRTRTPSPGIAAVSPSDDPVPPDPAGQRLPVHAGACRSPRPARSSTTSTCRTACSWTSTPSPTARTRSPRTCRASRCVMQQEPGLEAVDRPDPAPVRQRDHADHRRHLGARPSSPTCRPARPAPTTWSTTPRSSRPPFPACSPSTTRSSTSGRGAPRFLTWCSTCAARTAAAPWATLHVRQAIEYGVNKVAVQRAQGGPAVAKIINTAIPPGNVGYQNYNLYPDNNGQGDIAKCKAELAAGRLPERR